MKDYAAAALKTALEGYKTALSMQQEQDVETPADARLRELQDEANEAKAHLELVRAVVRSLPLAQSRNSGTVHGHEGVFHAASRREASNIGAVVLWGPKPNQQQVYPGGTGNWPYYVIGSRQLPAIHKRDPQPAELLLASAVPINGQKGTDLAYVGTWGSVVTAHAAASEQDLGRSLTQEEVDALFDPAANKLAVTPHQGARFWTKHYEGSPNRKTIDRAAASLAASGMVPVPDRMAFRASEFTHGIPGEIMSEYDVASHLFRLAAVFGQLAVYESALAAATVPDGPSALESYVQES